MDVPNRCEFYSSCFAHQASTSSCCIEVTCNEDSCTRGVPCGHTFISKLLRIVNCVDATAHLVHNYLAHMLMCEGASRDKNRSSSHIALQFVVHSRSFFHSPVLAGRVRCRCPGLRVLRAVHPRGVRDLRGLQCLAHPQLRVRKLLRGAVPPETVQVGGDSPLASERASEGDSKRESE